METPEQAALAVLDAFMDALNRRDGDAMGATFHFPHYRFASGSVDVFPTAADYGFERFDRATKADGWARSGWDDRTVIHAGADKVHLDVQFTRYRADGSTIGSYQSLWIVTCRDGRWGVEARSSFAP